MRKYDNTYTALVLHSLFGYGDFPVMNSTYKGEEKCSVD